MSRVNLESYDLEELYILISRTDLLAGDSPPKKKARSDAITSDLRSRSVPHKRGDQTTPDF